MKFRAKRLDNGELVEGYYRLLYTNVHQITVVEKGGSHEEHDVDPNTLAMSTGVTDKNGVEIFGSVPVDGVMSKGGDIVSWERDYGETEIKIVKNRQPVSFEGGRWSVNSPMSLYAHHNETMLITGKQYEHGSE